MFTEAGGVTANHIARWDGSAWLPLCGPSGTGMNDLVGALAAFDHGSGPTLYAGGAFTTAGGLSSTNFVAWRCSSELFADGFEGGNTTAWSLTAP